VAPAAPVAPGTAPAGKAGNGKAPGASVTSITGPRGGA
jgi:hypothetical protein